MTSRDKNALKEVEIMEKCKGILESGEVLRHANFDEDEFDTPSYLRKEEKSAEQRPAHREIGKSFEL